MSKKMPSIGHTLWYPPKHWVLITLFVIILSGCGGSSDSGSDSPQEPLNDPGMALTLTSPPANSSIGVLDAITIATNGIVADSVVSISANGNDLSELANLSDDELVIAPDTDQPWEPGILELDISISSSGSVTGALAVEFNVISATQALPRVEPADGFAPLTVTLIPDATTDSVIELFEWDLDNDGEFLEASDTIGRTITRVFDLPGLYPVTLRATDSAGAVSVETVVIEVLNRAPVVTAEVVPSNGTAPLNAEFSINASDNEGIALYEVDFEGDGEFDESSETSTEFDHVYDVTGNFQPVIRVTDVGGETTEVSTPDVSVAALIPGSPTVSITHSSRPGPAPITVRFSGSASNRESPVELWEWDFDGDGNIDVSDPDGSRSQSFEFTIPGVYFATLKVTSENGLTAQDAVRVVVEPEVTLEIETDTVDGVQTADFTVTTNGLLTAAIELRDSGGRTHRTLFARGPLDAGEYTFSWNGSDDQGQLVPHGPYFVIVSYDFDGNTVVFDPSTTTSGEDLRRQLTVSSASTGEFRPFADEPVEVVMSLERAAEMTFFMGDADEDQRTNTFVQRVPFGAGLHTFLWHGTTTAGALIPLDDTQYTVGAFAFSLGDNALFVNNQPVVDALAINPRLVTPTGSSGASVQLNLSKSARLDVRIKTLSTGNTIATLVERNQPVGPVSFSWNGLDSEGNFPAPGQYSINVVAVDDSGVRSAEQTVLFSVIY